MTEKTDGVGFRLRQLVKEQRITQDAFAKKHNMSPSTLEAYIKEKRNLPAETAIEFAKEYNVSLDWIYAISPITDREPIDTMSRIWLGLGKVFQVEEKDCMWEVEGEPCNQPELHLSIDRKFYEYLVAVKKLRVLKSYLETDEDALKRKRLEIHLEYEEYIKNVFGSAGFDEENTLVFDCDTPEIDCSANIHIADLL